MSGCEEGFTEFVAVTGYPALYKQLEAAQSELAAMGLFELLWSAVEQSEGLLRADRVKDSEAALMRAARDLMHAAG